LKKITQTWDVKDEEKLFLSDTCHFRFLKGWNWDVDVAAKALLETIK
jgi:hypothetical protein